VTRTLLLALHITGVAAWLGANFVQLVLTPRFDRAGATAAAAWTRQTIWLGERYYNVAGGLIALTGVGLVFESDWSWGSGFIWVGIAVLVVGGVLGAAHFAPRSKARLAALEAGDEAAASRALGAIVPAAYVDTILVLTAVLAMVDKWQA
jgi:hypothetical protein